MAAKSERQTNFSSLEREKLIEILQNYTIIKEKRKIGYIEKRKKEAWNPLLLSLMQMKRLQNDPKIS